MPLNDRIRVDKRPIIQRNRQGIHLGICEIIVRIARSINATNKTHPNRARIEPSNVRPAFSERASQFDCSVPPDNLMVSNVRPAVVLNVPAANFRRAYVLPRLGRRTVNRDEVGCPASCH